MPQNNMWYVKHPFDCFVWDGEGGGVLVLVRDGGRGPKSARVRQPDCRVKVGVGVGEGGVSYRTQPVEAASFLPHG